MKRTQRLLAALLVSALFSPVASAQAGPFRSVRAVSFSDATHGFIGGGYTTGTPSTDTAFLSWTSDRGQSWHAMRTSRLPIKGLGAGTGSAGMAVSDYADSVLVTTDGKTWASRGPVIGSPGARLFDVARFASGRWVTVGQHQQAPGGDVALIASSDDVGVSWAKRFEGPLYPPPNDSSPAPTTWAELIAVDVAPSGNVAWAVGNEYDQSGSSGVYKRPLIYRTADSGSTWTTQAATAGTGLTSGNPVTGVAAVSDNVAFASVQSPYSRKLLRTIDGGKNWSAVMPPAPSYIGANGLAARDADHVVLASDSGMIWWTNNASAAQPTWVSTTVDTKARLNGASMLDATHWVVVGDEETIWRTEDAGAHWKGTSSLKPPSVLIASPVAGFTVSPPVTISGTASDVGVGVALVEVRVHRADGLDWNGSNWVAGGTSGKWLRANSTDGWAHWSYGWLPDAATVASGLRVTVSARATDGVGQTSTVPQVSSRTDLTAERIEGADRFATAVAASRAAFPTTGTCDSVIIATGMKYADALGAAGLAGAAKAPVLLVGAPGTTDGTVLRADILKEMQRVTQGKKTRTVYILGSNKTVSDAMAGSIRTKFGVTPKRLQGPDRYRTAQAIAAEVKRRAGTAYNRRAFIVTGSDYPDALVVGPVAYKTKTPILLVGSSVDASLAVTLKTSLGVTTAEIIGSTTAVNATVAAQLKTLGNVATVTRPCALADRYAQGVKVADWAVSSYGFGWDEVGITTGEKFADALGAAVTQGTPPSAPLLLTPGATLNGNVATLLRSHGAQVHHVRFYGSSTTILEGVRDAVMSALRP